MRIPSLNTNPIQLVKPVWKNFSTTDTRKVFENFSIKNEILGNLSVGISDCQDGFGRWIIEIKNTLGKVFGKEVISIDRNNKYMTGYNILVEREYRQKNYRFGELLRLASIMEMIENKCPLLYIYSKDSAVYFHSKYKFEPAIRAFEERDAALMTIANDKSRNFKDLTNMAKILQKKINENKDNAKKQRELTQKTNILVQEYIKRAISENMPQKNHPFERGMDMILERKAVINNSDYYNVLFAQHGIDYKV